MRTKLLAATALAGSLAIASVVWGSAQAVPGPTATQAPNNGIVTLVGNEGGGGGGGGAVVVATAAAVAGTVVAATAAA